MPAPRDPKALLAAARLYYLEGLSQAEIATQLGTSRSNVSRMLTEAQAQGIVEIRHQRPGRPRARPRGRAATPCSGSARSGSRTPAPSARQRGATRSGSRPPSCC